MITRHIADLLYHHECVIVPGLGGFIKAFQPARILHTTNEFFPPSGTIAFNSGLAGNDGLLANYIASTEKKSYREAIQELRNWSELCMETLKQGEKVILEGIGKLEMNASGKIEFSPSKQVNFNADSFGLPVFFAKIVDSEAVIVPDIPPAKHIYRNRRLHRLVPETLKWAAVLAPFIAFGIWGSLEGNLVDNYVHNYTGMYSWVRSTPGKSAPVHIAKQPIKIKQESSEIIQSPADILASENISFVPNTVSYAELAKQNLTIAVADAPNFESKEINSGELKYHIIGGAFRDYNNALKLISMLEEKGFPASIVDTTSSGLYIVSMKGFNNYIEAASQLEEIKKSGFSASWILKKHNG
jgi:nucleoid DNA-binding protein/predicted transcriptional regulator